MPLITLLPQSVTPRTLRQYCQRNNSNVRGPVPSRALILLMCFPTPHNNPVRQMLCSSTFFAEEEAEAFAQNHPAGMSLSAYLRPLPDCRAGLSCVYFHSPQELKCIRCLLSCSVPSTAPHVSDSLPLVSSSLLPVSLFSPKTGKTQDVPFPPLFSKLKQDFLFILVRKEENGGLGVIQNFQGAVRLKND